MKRFLYLILFMICGLAVDAQDVHFSQFYNMPLHTNPSLTGHIPGTYRIKAIYRNQWNSITGGGVYSTPGLSFDMNFKLGKKGNSLGAGLTIINDQTGGGDFTNLYVLASAAYHMKLDKKEKNWLSFGLQGGFINKRIDVFNFIFSDQFDSGGNPTQATMENFANENTSGGDLRLGVTFSSYPSKRLNYKIGAAYMHLIPFNEQFLSGTTQDENLPGRLAAFAQAEIITKNPKFSIMPELLFMSQAAVTQTNLTLNFGYQVIPDFGLILGAGYRVQDAPIVNLGMKFKGVEFMASYDINVSQLSQATNLNGGFEVSLGYVGTIKKSVKPILPAIRYY